MNTDSNLDFVKKPMSTSYRLVFIFSIFMVFFVMIVGGATKSKSTGLAVLMWGYTAWLMFKRKNLELFSLYKVVFWFTVVCSLIPLAVMLVWGGDALASHTLTSISCLVLIGISVDYVLLKYFANQYANPTLSQGKSIFKSSVIDDKFWEMSLLEAEGEGRIVALWAKCLANSGGDESKAKSSYIKIRSQQLSEMSTPSDKDDNATSLVQKYEINPVFKHVYIAVMVLFLGLLVWDNFFHKNEIDAKGISDIKLGIQLRDVLKQRPNLNKEEVDSDGSVLYTDSNKTLFLKFESNLLKNFVYFCEQSDSMYGIKCGESSEKITKKFGNEIMIYCPRNVETRDTVKYFDIPKYGIRYVLSSGDVIASAVTDIESMKTAFTTPEDKCN
jgi:hypothetical protein